jgi:hypothetical protein
LVPLEGLDGAGNVTGLLLNSIQQIKFQTRKEMQGTVLDVDEFHDTSF